MNDKIEQWLRVVPGVLGAVGALMSAISGGADGLHNILSKLGVGDPYATWLAWAGFLLLAVFLLWLNRRLLPRRSRLRRPERFDLRVRRPRDLIGREAAIDDLAGLVEEHALVLMDGRSGAGKSALVEFGLIPALQARGRFIPVLVARHGGDWQSAPLRRAVRALWDALATADRDALGTPVAPAEPGITAETWTDLVGRVANERGRVPLLVFDQLDDYQTTHRSRFVGARGEWISPRQLTARNGFWRATSAALKAGTLRALLVTRADASAGLASFRLTEAPAAITVRPLAEGSLMPLLDGLTADDGNGIVVSEPDNGWEELKERLARDLPRNGLVLPQQIRLVLLGLASGPPPQVLTPARYRGYGEAAGIEGRYIQTAIRIAVTETGASENDVRALLGGFVERSAGSAGPKTRDARLSELASSVSPIARGLVPAMLTSLERKEIARHAPGIDGADIWRLDHDELARAVLAEARAADRYALALREHAERWRAAGGNILERWRRMLTVQQQAWLGWGRLRGKLRYGAERSYVAVSCVPPILVLALVAGSAWWGARELRLRAGAQEIVSALQQNDADGDAAVLELWAASAGVRNRFLPILFSTRSRLLNGGSTWPLALVGVSEPAAKDLAGDLIKRLVVGNPDANMQLSQIIALGAVALRLQEAPAKDLADDLRKRLAAGNVDAYTKRSLIAALGVVAARLGDAPAKDLAADLRQRLTVGNPDDLEQSSLIEALGAVAPRLGEAPARDLAADLRTRLVAGNLADLVQSSLIEALGAVAPRLRKSPAKDLADDLIKCLTGGDLEFLTQQSLIEALGAVAARLGEAQAESLVDDLIKRLTAGHLSPRTQSSLIGVLGAVAPRLGQAPAKDLVDDLRARLVAGNLNDITQQSLIEAMGAVAPRLEEAPAKDLAADLIKRLAAGNLDYNMQQSLTMALGAVAPRLGEASAKDLADELRKRLAAGNLDSRTQSSVIGALGAVAPRLGEVPAKDLTDDLLKRLAAGNLVDLVQSPLIGPLGAVAPRLGEAPAKDLAEDLLTRLAAAHLDPRMQSSLIGVLGAVAPRLEPAPAKDLADDLRARLVASNLNDITQQSLIEALVAVAPRLEEAPAKDLADDLIKRLAAGDLNDDMRRSLIGTLGVVARRLGQAPAKDLTDDLNRRLVAGNLGDLVQSSLIEALGAVAPRLAEAPARDLAGNLRERLVANRAAAIRRASLSALASTEQRSWVDQVAQRRAVQDILIALSSPLPLGDDTTANFAFLERVAGEPFHADLVQAFGWAHRIYGFDPDEIRPGG